MRWWARPTNSKRWERKRYGEIAERGFKAEWYNQCWRKWKEAGEPHGQWVQFVYQEEDSKMLCEVYNEPFVSNALPIEEQQSRLGEIYKVLGEKRHVVEIPESDESPRMTPIVTTFDYQQPT